MSWIRPLAPEIEEGANVLGGKASGLIVLQRLGLPVPPGFVIGTEACRAYLQDGRLPDGLEAELATAVADLESTTGEPLAVSVRSGAAVSMPGMMSTVLDVGSRRQLVQAVRDVFASWNTPRATTYRELHDIPHDLGTAVVVQAMVFGDRDHRSGSGVAFSRDPTTGERVPYGEVLFGRRGDDVVSGRTMTRPLADLADREPAVWAGLLDALDRIEAHYRDTCSVEFTYESGELWLLQVRSGGVVGRAAVRVAVDLVDEGVIGRDEALLRVAPAQLAHVRTPRIEADAVLARGQGASPGVAVGQVATTSELAVRRSSDGPVILVRPETSPVDLPGLAAAAGVLTARGGPASHAAVVARSMGKPAVVGAGDLTLADGTLVAIDGTSGAVVLGSPRIVTAASDAHLRRLLAWADEVSGTVAGSEEDRLDAAHRQLLTL